MSKSSRKKSRRTKGSGKSKKIVIKRSEPEFEKEEEKPYENIFRLKYGDKNLKNIKKYLKDIETPSGKLIDDDYSLYMLMGLFDYYINSEDLSLTKLLKEFREFNIVNGENIIFELSMFEHFRSKLKEEMSIYDTTKNKESGSEICSKCKSNNTSVFSVQLRSGDEAATQFIKCKNCGQSVKI